MQLVVQVKLAPYSESKLDVVRGSGKVGQKASVDLPHRLLNPVQVETVLTIGLVVLSLCGMVHHRPAHALQARWTSHPASCCTVKPCSGPTAVLRQVCSLRDCRVQAFSLGENVPDLAEDGAAHSVAVAVAWFIIVIGVTLTLFAIMSEAR